MKAILSVALLTFATTASAGGWNNYDTDYNFNSNYNNNQNLPTAYGGKGGNAEVDNTNSNLNLNQNSSRSTAGASAGATGIGVGIAAGGNAKAAAAGGSVDSTIRNSVSGFNYQSQDQGQSQSNSVRNGQRQSNSNSAVGSGNDTAVVVEGDTYEAPKKPEVPAIAPNTVTGSPTAPCYIPFGASGAYGGILSIGGSGAVKDHGCAFGEVARRAHDLGRADVANEALELMFQIVKEDAGMAEPKAGEAAATFSSSDHPSDDVLWYAQ